MTQDKTNTLISDIYRHLAFNGKVKNQSNLADKLGITKGHMSRLMNGAEPISALLKNKLTDIFKVNPIWLATNGQQGSMFTTDTPNPPISSANGMVEEPAAPYGPDAIPLIPTGGHHTTRSGNQFIELGNDHYLMLTPLVHEYAYGGYQSGFADPEYISDLPKHAIVVDGIHRGTYRTFVMRGDSMDNDRADAIRAGDKVTGRLLLPTHWGSRLHTHKFREWIIHTRNGILVKEIAAHNTQQGTLTLTSKNPDKDLYPDITIPLSDVLEIYNIIEVSKPR